MARALHQQVGFYKLGIVLIGRNHAHLVALPHCGFRHRSDDVVGFETRHFQDGNTVGLDEVLDDGYSPFDVLRRGLTLCLVFGEEFVAERMSCGVETDGQEIGLLLL